MPWLPSANVPRRQRRSNHGLRCQEGPLATVPIPSSPRQRWRHAKIEGNKCTSLGRMAILGRVPGACRRLCTRRCNSCQERFQKPHRSDTRSCQGAQNPANGWFRRRHIRCLASDKKETFIQVCCLVSIMQIVSGKLLVYPCFLLAHGRA